MSHENENPYDPPSPGSRGGSPRPPRDSNAFRESIRNSNGGAYLLFFGSFVFFNVVGLLLLGPLGMHLSTIATEIFGILGAALLWRQFAGSAAAPWPSFKLGVSPGALVVAIAAAVSLGFLANALAGLSLEIFPALQKVADAYSEQISELLVDATGLERALGIIGVCVAAPICEEALFRGTILQEQRKTEAVVVAVIINGVMFSAFHLNPLSAVGLALLGIFLAHITVRSGSLIPAIVAHAAVNTANAVVLPALSPESANPDVTPPLAELLATTGVLLVTTALLWWWTVHLTQAPTTEMRAGD